MDKEEKRIIKWKEIRKKGMTDYIIKYGVIMYGTIFFFAWVFLGPFIDHDYTFDFVYKESFRIKLIVFGSLSPIAGIFLADQSWKGMEKKYR